MIPFPTERILGPLENQLIPGLAQKRNKVSLEHLESQKVMKCYKNKNDEGMSQGHLASVKGIPLARSGTTEHHISIVINFKPLDKIGSLNSLLITNR